jgi:spore coat polysaccharide biosynthesis protein SpsF
MALLEVIIRRLRPACAIHELIVVTSSLERDDLIAQLCEHLSIRCFRGSEQNCLDRFYHAAVHTQADVIVRLTGDNPLVDGSFLDHVLAEYFRHQCQYISSGLSGTYPYGLAIEVMSRAALDVAWREAKDSESREHVTPFIYRNPARFRIRSLVSDQPLGHLRFTVDTPEDLLFIRQIFAHFDENIQFPWQAVVDLLLKKPELIKA